MRRRTAAMIRLAGLVAHCLLWSLLGIGSAFAISAVCHSDDYLKKIQATSPARLCYQRRSAAEAGPEQFSLKVYNFEERYDFYFDNGTPMGAMSGIAPYGKVYETLTYQGHRFMLRRPGSKDVVKVLTMDPARKLIVLGSVPEGAPMYRAFLDAREKLRFVEEYRAKNGGRDWIGFHGRGPPSLPYRGQELAVGESLNVTTDYGFWSCAQTARSCRTEPLQISLQLVSTSPRVLVVRNLVSADEAEAVVSKAEPRLKSSAVGQGEQSFLSETRTSKLAFLPFEEGMMGNLERRFADVLGIPLATLRARRELLQVVQYMQNQEYQPHLDASVSDADTRFLTMLAVFRPAAAGGCTSFPRAYQRKGLTVCLKQGDAVLFYSLLPDGNVDADSVHSGDRVEEGAKWVGNIWVHDNPALDAREAEL
eukprot:TRINITY_DN10589_c0_g1_i1.p1 TRINITY_DN10589_c0_g1~~TRINITY_DN10589_c0_g1_i1.p1  ORF type:complete len:422 (+),score=79.95 TRINITY_DN10589_c0_g1_i1:121-1386(+)